MKIDYYEALGVERTADDKTLKTAFRKLAMEYHPDRNPDNPEAERKCKASGTAYEPRKEPPRRAAYDRCGHAAFENGGMGGGSGNGFAGGGGFADIIEDTLGEMMGGGRRRSNGGRERG